MKFPQAKINGEGVPEITCEDLKASISGVEIIDVRRPDEYTGELGHVDGAKLSTLEASFGSDISKWPQDLAYVFVCRSGARSSRATAHALSLGFKDVYNMEGGMIAWNAAKFPTVK
ncbi:MAG: rhodanese-like domain-containing protein [Bdellovibrionota bacterium]